MTPLQRLCAGAAAVLGLLAPAPLLANAYDGIDNDGDTQVDEADEHVGPDMGRLEQECIATARFEPCFASHAMFCEQLALPGACVLIDLGSNCLGGTPASAATTATSCWPKPIAAEATQPPVIGWAASRSGRAPPSNARHAAARLTSTSTICLPAVPSSVADAAATSRVSRSRAAS